MIVHLSSCGYRLHLHRRGGDHLNIVAYFRIEQFDQKFFLCFVVEFLQGTSASSSVSILEDGKRLTSISSRVLRLRCRIPAYSKNIGRHVHSPECGQFASPGTVKSGRTSTRSFSVVSSRRLPHDSRRRVTADCNPGSPGYNPVLVFPFFVILHSF